MGITSTMALKLHKYVQQFDLTGDVLTFGRQDCYFGRDILDSITAFGRLPMPPVREAAVSPSSGFFARFLRQAPPPEPPAPLFDRNTGGPVDDVMLFKALGFKSQIAVDASAFEAAEIIHDMNLPGLKEAIQNRFSISEFDFCMETGTMEHVFNVPAFLANIHAILAPGGVMLHSSPVNNHVDHGFYQFSPTFFYDYYTANGYEILSLEIGKYYPDFFDTGIEWTAYAADMFDGTSSGGLGSAMYGAVCLVRKKTVSSCDKIPQQGLYRRNEVWAAQRS